jgi:hypothetical protein
MQDIALLMSEYVVPKAMSPGDVDQDELMALIDSGDLCTFQHMVQGALGAKVDIASMEEAIAWEWRAGEQRCREADAAARAVGRAREAALAVIMQAVLATREHFEGPVVKSEEPKTRRAAEHAEAPAPKRPKQPYTMLCPCCARSVPVDKNERPFACKKCDCGAHVTFCAHCGLNELAHPNPEDKSAAMISQRKAFCKAKRKLLK